MKNGTSWSPSPTDLHYVDAPTNTVYKVFFKKTLINFCHYVIIDMYVQKKKQL